MISRYRQQIDYLAAKLSCDVKQEAKFKNYGMMYPEWEPKPYIEAPIIDDQIDYLINLHELGHIVYKHGCGRPPFQHKTFYFDNGVLFSEAQAWNYALDHCLDEVQDASRIVAWDFALGSYYLHGYLACQGKPDRLNNGNRHHHEFVYDEPDEYFTETVKRIQGSLTDFKIKYYGAVKFPFPLI